MSDEALNAHLQWLDDCARAQVEDYETWLEGRVAQLEAENNAAKTHIREIIETTKAQRTEIEDLIADLAEAKSECNRLYGIGQDYDADLTEARAENAALSELLSPLVDVELERDTLKSALDVAMSENQRLTKIVEDYKEEIEELETQLSLSISMYEGDRSPMNKLQIENASLKAKLTAIECAGCGKTMLECECDD